MNPSNQEFCVRMKDFLMEIFARTSNGHTNFLLCPTENNLCAVLHRIVFEFLQGKNPVISREIHTIWNFTC